MQLQLYSGPTIHLREFRQISVYERILEGVPTRDDNRRLAEALISEVTGKFEARPVVLEPEERLLDRPATRRGVPAKIPSVGCIGRFVCFEPARDRNKHGSELVVLWFQDVFGLPDAGALERLKNLDWTGSARDFEW